MLPYAECGREVAFEEAPEGVYEDWRRTSGCLDWLGADDEDGSVRVEGMMELPGARGRVSPAEGLLLLGALTSTRLIREGPVWSPFWLPLPRATALVDADRLGPLVETAAGGDDSRAEEEADVDGLDVVPDFVSVFVDFDDLTVFDRLTAGEADTTEDALGAGGLVEVSLDDDGFEETPTSLEEAFLEEDPQVGLVIMSADPLRVDLLLELRLTPGRDAADPPGCSTIH